MPTSIQTAALFLTNTLFSLYLFVLCVRLILVYVGANYFNPLTQFVVKLTDFIIRPLRRIIRNLGPIETSTLVVILMLEIGKFSLLSLIIKQAWNWASILSLTLGDSISLIINCFFYGIVGQVILSWVQPYSPLNQTLRQFTSPIMNPIQRIVPLIAGLDISPIVAIVLLELLSILLVTPLLNIG